VYHYAGNNPVKYIDPDGEWVKNNTDHAIYVVYEKQIEVIENGKSKIIYGELLAPGKIYHGNGSHGDQGRVDGVITFDKKYGFKIQKISDKNGVPVVPINILVNQEDTGEYKFSISPVQNFLGDIAKIFTGRGDDLSGIFTNDEIPGSKVESWLNQAKKEVGNPKENPAIWDDNASK
jgi:hypothetical protein